MTNRATHYPTIVCKWCDTVAKLTYNDETIARLQKLEACFDCGYWMMHIEHNRSDDEHRYVITHDYEHYLIADEDGRGFRGFGGQPFTVRWFDETREPTPTTNLWSQGPIPERWRESLTPNATIVAGRPS